MRKTFKYRIYPTRAQTEILEEVLETARRLYNAALAERRNTYQASGQSVHYYDQASQLKAQRQVNPYLQRLNFSATQDVLRRLDQAFQAFFRRVQRGEKPGYPRFKGRGRWDSITFPSYGDGCKLRGARLYLQTVGLLKVKWHRPLTGRIKTVTIRRHADGWYVCFSCEVESQPLPPSDGAVGVDLGLRHLAITSDGEFFAAPKYLRKSERKLKRKQRQVARSQKGSQRRKKRVRELARLHQHIANQRRDTAHKVARSLVNSYGVIVFENLNTQGLMHNHHLAKSIADAGWHQLVAITTAKAAEAGRRVVLVDPQYTSQDCSRCGTRVPKTLAERVHRCPVCGYVQDRDINAAENILQRARAS